jgi:hypothetical protein
VTGRSFDLPSSQLVGAGSFVASLVAHVLLVGAGAYLFSAGLASESARPVAASEAVEVAVEVAAVDLPLFRGGPALGEISDDVPVPADPVAPGGGEPLARPDMERSGRGGSTRADSPALNLADRDDGLTLSSDVTSRIDRDQIQRLETSKDRASQDDRRSTTNPMDVVFLATGTGHVAERRPSARVNPSRGALRAPPAGVLGGLIGATPIEQGEFEPQERGDRAIWPRVAAQPPQRAPAEITARRRRLRWGGARRQSSTSIPADQSGRARTPSTAARVAATVNRRPCEHRGRRLRCRRRRRRAPSSSGGSSGPGSRAAPFGGGGALRRFVRRRSRISAYRRSVRSIGPCGAKSVSNRRPSRANRACHRFFRDLQRQPRRQRERRAGEQRPSSTT